MKLFHFGLIYIETTRSIPRIALPMFIPGLSSDVPLSTLVARGSLEQQSRSKVLSNRGMAKSKSRKNDLNRVSFYADPSIFVGTMNFVLVND